MQLTIEQIASYHKQGFLSGITVVSPSNVDSYRREFNALEAIEGRGKTQIGLIDRHFDQPFVWKLATNPVVLDCIEVILGPNILLLATHFFCKYGPEEKFVAWHQDATYWGLDPSTTATAWYAVDGSDVENGCMRVIPGSHLTGLREHGKAQNEGNLLSINQEALVTTDEMSSAVDLPLHAGQISIHDGWLIHSSMPNRSIRRRCGLTLRYVPTQVRQIDANSHGGRWKAVLVRGVDKEKNFGETKFSFVGS